MTDEQSKGVEIPALLSTAQQIFTLNPQKTASYVDGGKRSGWGPTS